MHSIILVKKTLLKWIILKNTKKAMNKFMAFVNYKYCYYPVIPQ